MLRNLICLDNVLLVSICIVSFSDQLEVRLEPCDRPVPYVYYLLMMVLNKEKNI